MDTPTIRKISGFSIIEAMVALIIVSVGFIGVYSLIGAAEIFRSGAVQRERSVLLVEQMFEVIVLSREPAIDLIANSPDYNGVVNLNAANCQFSGAQASGRPASTEDIATFFRQWCLRINAELGPAQPGELRTISVDKNILLASGTTVDLVAIVLQIENNEFIRDFRVL